MKNQTAEQTNKVQQPRDISLEEARELLEKYYRYLRERKMDHCAWDLLNESVKALGGEGDPTMDHDYYARCYAENKVTLREIMEDEIRWVTSIHEMGERLPDALRVAMAEMEKKGMM